MAFEKTVSGSPSVATDGTALDAYYADKRTLRRNVASLMILTLGWSVGFRYLGPLIQLWMKQAGVTDSMFAVISGVNSWISSMVGMYFAWKSDNTVSKYGRRIPFLMITGPVLIACCLTVPFCRLVGVLVAIAMVKAVFMDIKGATIPLLSIDCVPKNILARINSLNAIIVSVTTFFAMHYGMGVADRNHYVPFFAGAALLAVTMGVGIKFIKEPPVRQRAGGRFMLWSAMQVAWRDKRTILLMTGVGLSQIVSATGWLWIWLYADHKLHVSRGELGAIMSWSMLVPFLISFPAGWLIDRYQGMRVVVVHWALAVVSAWWMYACVHGSATLIVGIVLLSSVEPFYAAADMKVYRNAPRMDIGSITSTNQCMRSILIGSWNFLAGLIISHFGGNYGVAFLYAAGFNTVGLICIFIYTKILKPAVPAETTEFH